MTDAETIRAAVKALHDARREALHAEADRVQRVSLGDLVRDADRTESAA